jgi:hypothetical protein
VRFQRQARNRTTDKRLRGAGEDLKEEIFTSFRFASRLNPGDFRRSARSQEDKPGGYGLCVPLIKSGAGNRDAGI